MDNWNSNFIARTKLDELRKQRSNQLQKYDDLRAIAASPIDSHEKLKQLYEGLDNIQFANTNLHPDVNNLDILLYGEMDNNVSTALLDFWLKKLEDEINIGQARSEFVYIFGALLEQWASSVRDTDDATTQDDVKAGLISQLVDHEFVSDGGDIIDQLLGIFDEWDEEAHEHRDETIKKNLLKNISPDEAQDALSHIRGDIYRPATLRQQAQQFLNDDIWLKELADTLTIMLNNLAEWAWPATGMTVQQVWTRNKWRIFLNDSLPNAALLTILGSRWWSIFTEINHSDYMTRLILLQRMIEQGASEAEIQAARKKLRAKEKPYPIEYADLWEDWDAPDDDTDIPEDYNYHSIIAQRTSRLRGLHNVGSFSTYSSQPYNNNMSEALMLINAEIRLAQVAFPDSPLYLTKFDVQNFYPGLTHTLIMKILKAYKLDESHLNFFRNFLNLPLRENGTTKTAKRGIANDYILSHFLAEQVLRLFDQYVMNKAKVLIIRVVDDVCMIAANAGEAEKAWQAAQEFFAACGLAINMEKSGAVAIGGKVPASLPQQLPTWLMLEVDANGDWRTNQAKFDLHRQQTRARVDALPSIISKVEIFNANLHFLLKAIGMGLALGDVHRLSVSTTLKQFQNDFFGTGQHFVDGVRQSIHADFLEQDSNLVIPEAWLHWPITAGGLGINQGMIDEATYGRSLETHSAQRVPAEWKRNWLYIWNDWVQWYLQLIQPLQSVAPKKSVVMETMVKDFIERGSTITSGRQQGLSTYWRWLLYLYGPQILEYFGTFRFLITELVPLQLISQQRMSDTSLADGGE